MGLDNRDQDEGRTWCGALMPHPETAGGGVRSITVSAARKGRLLCLQYEVAGDISRLALPAPCTPRRTDGLWESTCFEAFIKDGEGYYEFNFSPSGEWALYRFESYRATPSAPPFHQPSIKLTKAGDSIILYTECAIEALPFKRPAPRCLGLAAVLKDAGRGLGYWALAHEDGPPDFHCASCFTGQIP